LIHFYKRVKCKVPKLWRVITFQGYYTNVNQRVVPSKMDLRSNAP